MRKEDAGTGKLVRQVEALAVKAGRISIPSPEPTSSGRREASLQCCLTSTVHTYLYSLIRSHLAHTGWWFEQQVPPTVLGI